MTLSILGSNLQEIYAAEHSPTREMIADPTGKYIYSTNAGFGILWSWIYKIADFLGIDFKINCFERAMTHTHRLFSEHLSKVIDASEAYEKNLQKRFLGENICEKENGAHRQCISQWYAEIAPFIKHAKEKQSASLKRIISTSFTEEYFQKYTVPFSEGTYSTLIKQQQQIVKLEGALKFTLPVNLLIKTSKKVALTRSEKESLQKFVHKINYNQQDIGVRNLHNALLNVIQKGKEYTTGTGEVQPDITNLESELLNLNCSLFLQKDQKHIDQSIYKSGDKIVCNNRILIIGERLGAVRENDQNIAYATDDPNIVVVVGFNTVFHPLTRMLIKNKGWGIRSAKYIDIDNKTGIALIERLYDPLASFSWVSSSDEIDPADEAMALPLCRLLAWFVEMNRTPINFSPKMLMFDRQGVLRCLKMALRGEFDYNALVNFAAEASAGNRYIFKHLMQKSELIKHRFAKFYEDVAHHVLQDEKVSAKEMASSRWIIDQRIIERGKELAKEVLKLKDRCVSKIKPEGLLKDSTLLGYKICDQVYAAYRNSGTAGILPVHLEKEIIQKINWAKKKH